MVTHCFIALRLAVTIMVSGASAQWLKPRTAGIPHTPDGKPNLSPSAPGTPHANPDLSGWLATPCLDCSGDQ
jgi:hypothetical protein